MEGNKDEAERCYQLANKYLKEGNVEKAGKLLIKAENLYPTKRNKDLLDKIMNGEFAGKEQVEEETPDDLLRNRKTTSAGSSSEAEYSDEQLLAVKRIQKCKDYYEALGISKDATDTDIKKAYKKLALQLHPDKNKAPGAVEAFKSVSKAAAVLTDAEKRKSYDLHGPEEQMNKFRRGNDQFDNEFAQFRQFSFEKDFSAEELFDLFFGGSVPVHRVYERRRYRQQAHRDDRREQSGYAAFINLLPIILLIGLSMMSSFFISDPIYSLAPSQKFSIARKTNQLKIPYYVKDNFHSEYQGSVGRLEASVEEDYLNNLKHSCYRERNYKETMLMKARNFGDRDLYHKAQNIQTPSCDKLQSLHN